MEDVTAGSTLGATVPDSGQTEGVGTTTPDIGQTENTVPVSQEEGSQERETSSSEVKGKYGEFGDDPDKVYEGYKSLETKLGNWKETEQRSKFLDQVLQNTDVQKALGLSKEAENTPQETPVDFSEMPPEKVIEYHVDKAVGKAIEQRFKERVEPIAQEFYNQKAENTIKNVRAKFPDFDEHRDEVSKYLNDHPTLVGDEATLTDIYKIVSYDKARSKGEEEALKKLREKKTISMSPGGAPSMATQRKATSIKEAYRMAKESL